MSVTNTIFVIFISKRCSASTASLIPFSSHLQTDHVRETGPQAVGSCMSSVAGFCSSAQSSETDRGREPRVMLRAP